MYCTFNFRIFIIKIGQYNYVHTRSAPISTCIVIKEYSLWEEQKCSKSLFREMRSNCLCVTTPLGHRSRLVSVPGLKVSLVTRCVSIVAYKG